MLREERGLTLRELAAKLDISHSVLAAKERGKVRIKPPERKRIAKALGLTLDAFDDHWRGTRVTVSKLSPGIPVVNRAPAGQVLPFEECFMDSGHGFEFLERGDVGDELAFAVIVTGESMEPGLHDGDYLVFSPLTVPKPRAVLEAGNVVFVRFTPESGRDGCTIARYQRQPDGRVVLTKDNPKHAPIVCRTEDIQQLAVAIEKRSKRI